MSYTPSTETIDVLLQAGYDEFTLQTAIDEFSEIYEQFPEFIKASDKAFYYHLKNKFVNKSVEVRNNLDPGTSWRLGYNELSQLESEGYWDDLVNDLLGEFLFQPKNKTIAISKFSYFRAFVRKRYPLIDFNIHEWRPDIYLLKLVRIRLFIQQQQVIKILPLFKHSVIRKEVPGKRIPRYFYHYVKHNRKKLLSSTD